VSFSLSLSPAQLDLVERTHAFARDVIRPAAEHYDREQEFPWPILEQAAAEGFYNPLFYRDLIGDPTGLSLPLFMEELFWGCAGIGLSIVMPALALSAIAQAATPEQLLRWAPDCFGGPGALKLAALAISEPEGGSDVRNLRTRARRDGDEWVLDGHKIWIGNGGIADVHVVNATVDPELGHRGQALFIVPKGTPGLEMVRKLDKLGCRASHTAELRFEGCRVPADHLLGGDEKLERRLERAREAGNGASATLGAFEQTRPMVAAQALGIGRAALEFACDRRGLDVEAQGVRGRRADRRAGDPGRGRLGLHQGPPGGEVVPRREALHDLRGHERDPARRDRAHARRRRHRGAAAPPDGDVRRGRGPRDRSRQPPALARRGHCDAGRREGAARHPQAGDADPRPAAEAARLSARASPPRAARRRGAVR
jgi:alkylation response protein AidB-like acyl-CoA dehydrogenase